jgi:cytidylate kinase
MARLITVARQHGSQGELVAQEVARLLEANFLDKEIIGLAAQRAGVAESAVAERDERTFSVTEHVLRMVAESLAHNAVPDAYPDYLQMARYEGEDPGTQRMDPQHYLELITGVMKDLAQAGNAVVMGRGGNIILKDAPGVLRVFVVAPLEVRVRRVMEQEGVDAREATRRIHRVDGNRAAFIKQLVQAEWDDPANYDLVVNTSRCPTGYIAQLIADAARDWPAPQGSKTP